MSSLNLTELEQEQLDAQKEGKRKASRLAAQERDDVRAVMRTPEGRRFMFRMLNMTGLEADPFRGEQSNTTAYLCGRAGAGRDQRDMVMRWAADEYLLMIKEAKPKEKDNDD